jgi:apolipoprotein N-acyltransferase
LRRSIALALLGGVLYFLGFVGFGIFPLEWICFVPILIAIRDVTPKRALLLGTIFGLATNMGGYYWVIHLIEEFADLNILLAILGYLLLCLYQGFLLAIVIALVRRAELDLKVKPIWSLPVIFPAVELAYPLLFPSYIGNSQYKLSAVTQIVEVTGMLGLTALISLVNGAVYEAFDARLSKRRVDPRRVGFALGTLALVVVYGLIRLPMIDAKSEAAPKLKVLIVQTNLGARDKNARRSEFIARHQEMTKRALAEHPDIDLVVWPESAYNEWISRTEKSVRRRVTSGIDKPVIFGALTYTPNGNAIGDAYNTAVLTSSTGDIRGMFDKMELLAFGETIPFGDTFPILKKWFFRGAFDRGKSYAPLATDKAKLLPMICYEDIIPRFVRAMWNKGGPSEAMVNITNDSWYGNSHEPLLHLVLASFRSIETRRPLVRSTNTGISALVDPAGRIFQRTGQWTQETLIGEVPLIGDGSTTIYMMYGDYLGWASIALVVFGWIKSRKVRRSRPRKG